MIDAVGRPETWLQAFYGRDLAGTVVLVGVPNPTMQLEIPLIDVFGRGGSLKSSWYGDCLPSRDFPVLTDLYLQGRLPLEKFVSEEIALTDIESASRRCTAVRYCAASSCCNGVFGAAVTAPHAGGRRGNETLDGLAPEGAGGLVVGRRATHPAMAVQMRTAGLTGLLLPLQGGGKGGLGVVGDRYVLLGGLIGPC